MRWFIRYLPCRVLDRVERGDNGVGDHNPGQEHERWIRTADSWVRGLEQSNGSYGYRPALETGLPQAEIHPLKFSSLRRCGRVGRRNSLWGCSWAVARAAVRTGRTKINRAIRHIEQEWTIAWHKDQTYIPGQLFDVAPLNKLRIAFQLRVDELQFFCSRIGAEFNGLRVTFGLLDGSDSRALGSGDGSVSVTLCQCTGTVSFLNSLFRLLCSNLFRFDSFYVLRIEDNVAH